MRAEGVVIALDGNKATVSVVQQSACAGCSASCANCHKKVTHDISVDNNIGAVIGENVWVESSAKHILLLCLLLFIVPPVIAGVCCSLLWGIVSGGVLFIVTFGVALLGFMMLYLTVGKRIAASNKYVLAKKY